MSWLQLGAAGLAGIFSTFTGRHENRETRLANQHAQEEAQRMRNQDIAYQKEFAQHGIRWRVEDAKAAGLHPLSALGAAGASYTPGAIPVMQPSPDNSMTEGLGRAGIDIGRAYLASQTSTERSAADLQLKLLSAQVQRTEVETAAIASAEQRAWQQQWQSKPINFDGTGLKSDPFWGLSDDVGRGGRQADINAVVSSLSRVKKPDEVVASRPEDRSLTAGEHTAMQEYWISPSLKMRLPRGDSGAGPSEAMENVPTWAWPAIIQQNMSYYGPDWGRRFLREFMFGNEPRFRQEPDRPRSKAFGETFHGAP